jgi:nucleotide-binding universal stress UspA family protein
MFNRILVTMDHSHAISQSTFETAVALAQQNQARLMLLHVLTPEGWEKRDSEGLQSLHQNAKNQGLASDVAELLGEPEHIICDLANRWGADLIVLGQQCDQELPNTSAFSEHFTEHAPCSVLIAQHPSSLHLQQSRLEPLAMH